MGSLKRRDSGTVVLIPVLGRAFVLILFFLVFTSPTLGATVFVKSDGNDSNPCTREKPCRQLSHALDVVDTGGEIIVLDSGLYKALIIKKAVTIEVASGQVAVVLPEPFFAIRVSAPGTVVLRGLTLIDKIFPTSINIGIERTPAKEPDPRLIIENCVISGFGVGILGGGNLILENTLVHDCVNGAWIQGGQALIDRSRFLNNKNYGVVVRQSAQVAINQTVFSGNSDGGIAAESGQVTVESCVVVNNNVGIRLMPGPGLGPSLPYVPPVVRVANTLITNNQIGLQHTSVGGLILTRGPASNTLVGNVLDGVFNASYVAR